MTHTFSGMMLDSQDLEKSRSISHSMSIDSNFTVFSQDDCGDISTITNESTKTEDIRELIIKNKEISERIDERLTSFTYMVYRFKERNNPSLSEINASSFTSKLFHCDESIEKIIVKDFLKEIQLLKKKYDDLVIKLEENNKLLKISDDEKRDSENRISNLVAFIKNKKICISNEKIINRDKNCEIF